MAVKPGVVLLAIGAGVAALEAVHYVTTHQQATTATAQASSAAANPAHPSCKPPYGDAPAMQSANPNFAKQMPEWQGLRSARGEDPFDWGAFRIYQRQINAPDPGANPPSAFCAFTG